MSCIVRQLGDVEVMRLVQLGDESAQTELVRRFSNKMHALAFRITHSTEDAKDAVQDAWASIFQNAVRFQFRSKPATWIFRITYNAALMVRRKNYVKHGRRSVSIDRLTEAHPRTRDHYQFDPLDELIRGEDVSIRLRVICALPAEFRLALSSLAISDFQMSKAAQGLKISYMSLKSRVHRARVLARADHLRRTSDHHQ